MRSWNTRRERKTGSHNVEIFCWRRAAPPKRADPTKPRSRRSGFCPGESSRIRRCKSFRPVSTPRLEGCPMRWWRKIGKANSCMNKRLQRIRHVALDMGGTIYKGGTLCGATDPFLALLRELGIGYTFLTNNPSKSVTDYLAHLRDLGIPATQEQLYTSTQATIEFLQENWPAVRRLFVLGTPSMCEQFKAAGFVLLPDSPHEVPDAVIAGFDSTLTYPRLCRAAWWISQGKPYFATNPDRVCPTDQPTVLVDCGSIFAALEAATAPAPAAVMGKPDPGM